MSTPVRILPREFIAQIWPTVGRVQMRERGLYPSVCIAQASLETGYGNFNTLGNNIFGIKHHYGMAIYKQTREVLGGQNVYLPQPFQFYATLEEAVNDYCWLLPEHPKFAGQLVGLPRDEFIEVLGPLYATDAPASIDGDPSYAEKIASIIERYGLDEFDEVEGIDNREETT